LDWGTGLDWTDVEWILKMLALKMIHFGLRLGSSFAEAAGAATKLLLESDNKAKQAAVGVTVPDNVTPVKFHCELGDVVLLEV
jgi:hypothetical protein